MPGAGGEREGGRTVRRGRGLTLFAHFPDGLATRGVDLALQIKLNISSNLQEVETLINNSKFHEDLIRPSLGGDAECTVKVSTKLRGMPLLATCP